ncbi:MAG TPA: DUF3347 domain-containing protein [Puia sp.]|nr:DUF3347 domain-containing protein [Puia sp.]
MQKLFLIAALAASMTVYAQESALSPVLTGYFKVKDALVKDDARAAAAAAAQLLSTINGVNTAALTPKGRSAFMSLQPKLAYDARHISESSEIAHQREHFASLSTNMTKLAMAAPLSQQPIYEEYCPMKKAYWLAGDSAIRNPYFGSAMTTCGRITHTLRP